jgi:predicted O-methyltransferase YrrM
MTAFGELKALLKAALAERVGLQMLPREACDSSALGSLEEAGLRALLADVSAGADWTADLERLGPNAPPDGTGGVNPGDRRAIYTLIRKLSPRTVLEIGTHIAASTASIALALQRNGVGTLTTVDIVDVNDPASGRWRERGAKLRPRDLVKELGCAPFVQFHTAASIDFLDHHQELFDFIFLDGDHQARTVYRELPRALRRLARPGFVLLHDYCPGGQRLWAQEPAILGPWLAVQRLVAEGARLHVMPLGALPWPTKRGGHVTSLALVSGRP